MKPDDKGSGDEGRERRRHRRYDVKLQVDASSEDTFLFSYISNISEVGIFLSSHEPMPIGTRLKLRFGGVDQDDDIFELEGEVVWVNPFREAGENLNPGMGVRFVDLDDELRERIVRLVKTIAYLHDNWV